ncbi:MAG: pirin family protein [Desulfobacterales bacterium]|nr:pirin family protein [Desulfobacterales bacterium]
MAHQVRKVARIIEPRPVLEGAGVRLIRSIATAELDHVDPFLLFDHFGSSNPDDYMKGFPMHPHRGIETVTYMIRGRVNHKDSIGNLGSITDGDVQWMTSGRGILHEEMPQQIEDEMKGFQLWVNLPAKLKMTAPRYQNIASEQIPEVLQDDGVIIRVIAGEANGVSGPVKEIYADPIFQDVSVPPNTAYTRAVASDHAAIAYVFEGEGDFGTYGSDRKSAVRHPRLIVFGNGDRVSVQSGDQGVRFLLIAGKPLNEPIARYGPFVMNTQAEIEQTLNEIRNGTFVKTD